MTILYKHILSSAVAKGPFWDAYCWFVSTELLAKSPVVPLKEAHLTHMLIFSQKVYHNPIWELDCIQHNSWGLL